MVDTLKSDFARIAKIYVANNGYPSIHIYTVDAQLIEFARNMFHARIIQHKGTFDVVISKRCDVLSAATMLSKYCGNGEKPLALTLIKYCTSETKEGRDRVIKRLSRQIGLRNQSRDT